MRRGTPSNGSVPVKFVYPSDTPGYVDTQEANVGVFLLPRKGDYIRTTAEGRVLRHLVDSVEWDYTGRWPSVTVRTSRA